MRTMLLVSATAALLAGLAGRLFPPQRFVARRLGAAVERLPSRAIPQHLQQVAMLGNAAIPVLVDSIGSERADVATAAANTIDELIERWRSLPTDQSTPLISELASELAQHVASFTPASRQLAARFASDILLWPIDRDVTDGTTLVRHCEIVFSASDLANLGEDAPTLASAASPRRSLQGQPADDPVEQNSLAAKTISAPDVERSPPSRVQPPPIPIVPALPSVVEARPSPSNEMISIQEPRLFPIAAGQRVLQVPPQGSEPPSTKVSTPPEEWRDWPQDGAGTEPGERLQRISDLDVMRALHSDSMATVAAAEQELITRGYQLIDLRLARHLVHPDPTVRRRLVNALPGLAGIDPRPWLRHLTRDENSAVRREAAAVLGTSRDPAIKQWLRDWERTETDPWVLRQVRQGLQGR